MNWSSSIKGFKNYLQLERSLSANSIEAYLHDVEKFVQFLELKEIETSPEKVSQQMIEDFLQWISELGLNARSQARILSGLKAFYKYFYPALYALKNSKSKTVEITHLISEFKYIFDGIKRGGLPESTIFLASITE